MEKFNDIKSQEKIHVNTYMIKKKAIILIIFIQAYRQDGFSWL